MVDVAVPQFRTRTRQNRSARNEAPLNFVSLRSALDYGGLDGLSRVKMNAQQQAPLTALQRGGTSVSRCSIDTADDFIDVDKSRL